MRVVSLLPAATETVAALGAGGYLVGVSHECDYPPEVRALPRVTRTRIDSTRASGDIDRAVTEAQRAGTSAIDVDVELVARLRPDVIIGQALCPVCAVGAGDLERLVATLMPTPWVVTLHAHTLDGVLADIHKVGETLELKDEADELVAGLRYRLRRVADRTQGSGRPRVLVLEWLDPPYVAGQPFQHEDTGPAGSLRPRAGMVGSSVCRGPLGAGAGGGGGRPRARRGARRALARPAVAGARRARTRSRRDRALRVRRGARPDGVRYRGRPRRPRSEERRV